jgi:hypothetical protein
MTIPASEIVQVNPGVVGTGGNPLALNGVILTKSTLIPTNSVQSFSSAAAVSSFFGPASTEYVLAQIYFLGNDNSTQKPGTLLFAPYVDTGGRGAWLRSGSFATATLADITALSGVLTLTVDGVSFTSSSINLATASSFSDAATKIAAGFTGAGKPTCSWNAVNSTFTLDSPTLGASSTITVCTGTLSAGLKFTAATGATLSQGDVADTPGTAMDAVKAATQNWVSFTTVFEPITADKQLFAVWASNQNQRYMYVAWDTDAQAIVNGSTTCFGYLAKSLAYDGVVAVSGDAAQAALQGTTLAILTMNLAVFVLGAVASIDFARTNGRITAAFKSQSGFIPTVTVQQTATNLLANGYSFYGSYATANDQFNFLYNGQMSGKWKWIDTFVDQVYLNSQFQLALISLLTSVNSIPYNQSGYSLIRSAMIDPISSAINFGGIRAGVTMSAQQKAIVNQAAGLDVSSIIEQQGYYLQILDPGAQVRGNRGTPVINFWYTDGGAVQKITVASIDIL